MSTIVCGGLGSSQVGDIWKALKAYTCICYSCPQRNGYQNIQGMLAEACLGIGRINLIGHSFGADAVIQVAHTLAIRGLRVGYLGLVEPVSISGKDLELPTNISTYNWFRRRRGFDFSFTCRANVIGATPWIIEGGHNDVPHDLEVIGCIITRLRSLDAEENRSVKACDT